MKRARVFWLGAAFFLGVSYGQALNAAAVHDLGATLLWATVTLGYVYQTYKWYRRSHPTP